MKALVSNVVPLKPRSSRPLKRLPTDAELMAIPLIEPGIFELTDKETKQLRARLYALNKNNTTWKWGSRRYAPLLVVWRLRI